MYSDIECKVGRYVAILSQNKGVILENVQRAIDEEISSSKHNPLSALRFEHKSQIYLFFIYICIFLNFLYSWIPALMYEKGRIILT